MFAKFSRQKVFIRFISSVTFHAALDCKACGQVVTIGETLKNVCKYFMALDGTLSHDSSKHACSRQSDTVRTDVFITALIGSAHFLLS